LTEADLGETVAVDEDAPEPTDRTATDAAPIEVAPPVEANSPAEDTTPDPLPTGRRIRSASALVVAALLVAVGVFLTLGGVDALVRHGPGSSPGQPRPSASVPANAARTALA
jgi:hypothetical protein